MIIYQSDKRRFLDDVFTRDGYSHKLQGIAVGTLDVIWVLAGLRYITWLGRLAVGLGRSVITYVGGTIVAAGAICFLLTSLPITTSAAL